ncbi:MAG: helicase C-terminal domain-containing protein [Candidatus Nanoarchaeia archaeon]
MWNLYQDNKFLKPLVFSNGKSQADIVKEVLNFISKGNKIIFIHGVCGTGKSAIALNIARKLGKSSVIVPGKNLQNQYKKDYENDKYLLKSENEKNFTKLKISVITGRNNHKCKFLEDNKNAIPKIKKEVNAKLNDIFERKIENTDDLIAQDISADNYQIPCKIEIKEKNFRKIKEYLKKNDKIDHNKIHEIRDAKRIPIAMVCPYWSPVLSEKYEIKLFENYPKRKYIGLDGNHFVFYKRKLGCGFYEQFNSYLDSDVIVFNSLKYKLESALGRKPLTEIEIVDECDQFLDSFSNQRNLNIERLQNSLIHVVSFDEKIEKVTRELHELVKNIKKDPRIGGAIYNQEIIPIKETEIYNLLKVFLNSPEFLNAIDEESYLFEVEETAKMFEDFFDETYLTFNKKEGNLIVSIVTTNLEKKLKEMVNKNKIIVLMSGTLHSENVLRNVFGLENYKIIKAETRQQGQIEVIRTGLEMNCKYANFSNGNNSRKKYLKALSKCVEISKKPTLVHVSSFSDLPSEAEIEEFDLDNLISRDKLREIQREDKVGKLIERFKKGQTEVLFSTRAARGIDFPGEECNSIVFTKYPYPNVQDSFWRILKQTKPQYYWDFYKDKAKRELLQKIYRGLRFKEDHIFLLSPDIRVLETFENGEIRG